MSGRPRRSAHLTAEKKLAENQKNEKVEEEEEEVVEEQDDDDQPPPILEREASCGENEDTDGDGKEEEDADSTSPGSKKGEEIGKEAQGTLLAALSNVFATDKKTTLSRRYPSGVRHATTVVRPVSCTPSPTTSSSSQVAVASGSTRSAYGTPPPMPRNLRNIIGTGATSLSSIGKRALDKDKESVLPAKRTSLVAYNGGRAGEQFRKLSDPSTSASIDLHSMLRDQSPVRIQVSAGAQNDGWESAQDTMDVASQQKDTISSVVRNASNHSVLLGSMIINGLNTLQERNAEDYQNFSTDLFALVTKYRLQ